MLPATSYQLPAKKAKAGLVDPASDSDHNSLSGLGSDLVNLDFVTAYKGPGLGSHLFPRLNYITSARFSNSNCRTGKEHPAISTRPAASRAACGDTP